MFAEVAAARYSRICWAPVDISTAAAGCCVRNCSIWRVSGVPEITRANRFPVRDNRFPFFDLAFGSLCACACYSVLFFLFILQFFSVLLWRNRRRNKNTLWLNIAFGSKTTIVYARIWLYSAIQIAFVQFKRVKCAVFCVAVDGCMGSKSIKCHVHRTILNMSAGGLFWNEREGEGERGREKYVFIIRKENQF